MDMVYVCDSCGALFSRAGKQDHCPDCGRSQLHSANPEEQHEYAAQMAELIRQSYADSQRFPNTVETEISMVNCFTFKLPVTALQIDSDQMVELMVEFGENAADRGELTANVWAIRESGRTSDFLMSVYLPNRRGESMGEQVSRVFDALSGNREFTAKLFDFITEQMEAEDYG